MTEVDVAVGPDGDLYGPEGLRHGARDREGPVLERYPVDEVGRGGGEELLL